MASRGPFWSLPSASFHLFMLSVGDFTLKVAQSMVLSSEYVLMCLVQKDKLAVGSCCGLVGCRFSVDALTVPCYTRHQKHSQNKARGHWLMGT